MSDYDVDGDEAILTPDEIDALSPEEEYMGSAEREGVDELTDVIADERDAIDERDNSPLLDEDNIDDNLPRSTKLSRSKERFMSPKTPREEKIDRERAKVNREREEEELQEELRSRSRSRSKAKSKSRTKSRSRERHLTRSPELYEPILKEKPPKPEKEPAEEKFRKLRELRSGLKVKDPSGGMDFGPEPDMGEDFPTANIERDEDGNLIETGEVLKHVATFKQPKAKVKQPKQRPRTAKKVKDTGPDPSDIPEISVNPLVDEAIRKLEKQIMADFQGDKAALDGITIMRAKMVARAIIYKNYYGCEYGNRINEYEKFYIKNVRTV